jgi:hypothetical protein
MECADKPYGRRRRRRRRQLRVRTARALLVLALRCINHHCIRCLHGLRPRLEDLRQGAQPQLGLARGCGLGALQFWQRRANRVSAVAHRTAHPAEPGGGWGLRASRLLRSLRGFEHAVANGAASAAAPSEAHPKEEREDASDEGCRSVAGIRAASDDDQLAASSALALPVAAARHACLRAAPAVAHRTRGSRATAAGRRQHSAGRVDCASLALHRLANCRHGQTRDGLAYAHPLCSRPCRSQVRNFQRTSQIAGKHCHFFFLPSLLTWPASPGFP